MSREAENALLLLVGIATAMIAVGGSYIRYVKPSLLPWLVASAVVLVALALVSIVADIRHGSAVDDGHDHRGSVAWLLVVPVAVLIFIVPPALRPQAAASKVAAVSTQVLKRPFPPLPAGRAPEVSVPEVMIRAAQDTAGTLTNRLITVTGFTLAGGGGVDLGRVVIICCAADAQLARIHLSGPEVSGLAVLPEQTWLRVEGVVIPAVPEGDSTAVPTMEVHQATRIEAPANVYA
ncbi:MAG: TIGR03943 family protein [Mycobacterium sp.]